MIEVRVERVLRYRNALRAQVVVELPDAEAPARRGQEMTLEPAKRHGIGDRVTLDDVPENHNVHVPLEQRETILARQSLGFGESTLLEVGAHGSVECNAV